MSTPLRQITSLYDIRERLAVLYAKADRIELYNETCAAGHPLPELLDEKQHEIMALYACEGGPFPALAYRTLRRTIDVLEAKRQKRERRNLRREARRTAA